MKIPKTLKIGGHIFKIKQEEIKSKSLGATYWTDAEISLDKRLPQTIKESTLIHEIFHVLNCTLDDDKIGHALLDSLSEQFYQVLKDNKLLK